MTRVKMRIEGDKQIAKLLRSVAPNSARNIMRNALQDLARDTRDEIKSRVPVAQGILRRAIVVRRRRGNRGRMVSNVVITHGKGVKYDAYYWHFVEFGTAPYSPGDRRTYTKDGRQYKRKVNQNVPARPAQPFITPGTEAVRAQTPRKMREYFGKRFEREMQRLAKQRRR